MLLNDFKKEYKKKDRMRVFDYIYWGFYLIAILLSIFIRSICMYIIINLFCLFVAFISYYLYICKYNKAKKQDIFFVRQQLSRYFNSSREKEKNNCIELLKKYNITTKENIVFAFNYFNSEKNAFKTKSFLSKICSIFVSSITVLSAINDDPHILVNFSFLICMGYFIYYIIDMYILKRNVDDSIVQFLGDIFINYNSYKKYLK